MLHPIGSNGIPIDASFAVQRVEDGFAINYASRGGTKGTSNARNIEYHIGLTVLLERLRDLRATITDLLLNSAGAQEHSASERRLNLPSSIKLPIDLVHAGDVDVFRRKISEAQRNVVSAPGRNAKHGNRVRAIRIVFRLPQEDSPLTIDKLEASLVREDLLSTSDHDELRRRAAVLRAMGEVKRPAGCKTPAVLGGGPSKRFARSLAVAAYVLQRASGNCELCGSGTFITDSGEAYLEVHHVLRLAAGGPDTVENAVAVCANCHRKLHFGKNKGALIEKLTERVGELVVPKFMSVSDNICSDI